MSGKYNVAGIKKDDCCGCFACFNICPQNAVKMDADAEGFWYPQIDELQCIQCGKCKRACPGIYPLQVNEDAAAFAGYSLSLEEHMSSSSGGFFSAVARKVLTENGIVFGAAFDENAEVRHIGINSFELLEKLKGTKYVQSRIGTSFTQIKRKLEEGKIVLFSGTPCQIAGLKTYLGREYETLLCIDLICHGVPSPKVLSRYLSEQYGKNNVCAVQFRDKTRGMQQVMINYLLRDERTISESYRESPYIKGFISNYYIRPSCYQCKFKGIERCSDITIGDFFSVKEFHPEIDDQYGVSAILVHTEKGKRWLSAVSDQFVLYEAKASEIAVWNECLLESVEYNPERDVFFKEWENSTVAETVLALEQKNRGKQRAKKTWKEQIVWRIKKWLV